jgi:hypothetical protein
MPTLTADELAAIRQECKGENSSPRINPDDPLAENRVGAAGELAFANAFGFEVDGIAHPNGDGGVDFRCLVNGRKVTIDIKTANTARYLLIPREAIRKCADILVLCAYDRGVVQFIGWETRSIMACMPTANFGLCLSHFRPASELRPIGQLVQLLADREPYPQPLETENAP